jgi:hypothetical protein
MFFDRFSSLLYHIIIKNRKPARCISFNTRMDLVDLLLLTAGRLLRQILHCRPSQAFKSGGKKQM